MQTTSAHQDQPALQDCLALMALQACLGHQVPLDYPETSQRSTTTSKDTVVNVRMALLGHRVRLELPVPQVLLAHLVRRDRLPFLGHLDHQVSQDVQERTECLENLACPDSQALQGRREERVHPGPEDHQDQQAHLDPQDYLEPLAMGEDKVVWGHKDHQDYQVPMECSELPVLQALQGIQEKMQHTVLALIVVWLSLY